jgi:MSHA pilin protein MshA
MTQRQKGFTLIELVVVIIILGILAATAMPRFLNLQVEARTSSLQAAYGAVRAAAAITHSGFLAQGVAPNGNVNLDGQDVRLCNGYPAAASIALAASINRGGATDYVLAEGDLVTGGSVTTITAVNAATPATCVITYTAAVGTGTATFCTEPGNGPDIKINIAGC